MHLISLFTRVCFASDAPICESGQIVVYPASLREVVNITCSVDANPPDLRFWWGKSNQNSNDYVLSENKPANLNKSLHSVLQLNVQSSKDFSNYWCKAKNSIGTTKPPCIFRIVPREPPDKLKSCLITPEDKGLVVDCFMKETSLPATYHVLELYEVGESRRLVKLYNNSLKPSFRLENIGYNSPYWLTVYSVNQAGISKESVMSLKGNKSEPIPLYISDPSAPKDQSLFNPLLEALTLILVVSISIMAAVLLVIIMVRRKIAKNVILQPNSSNSIASFNFNSDSAPTPDIIPSHEFEFEISNKMQLMESIKGMSEEFIPTTQVSLENGRAFTICDLPAKIVDGIGANHASIESRSTLV